MANRSRKKKSKQKEWKYFIRRMILLLILLALVVGGIFLGIKQLRKEGPEEPSASQSQPEEPEEPSESQPERSEPEPSEPEEPSKPEPPPITETNAWMLVLASAQSPLPEGYAPPELATVTTGYQVDSRMVPDLTQMINDAKQEGVSLMICSAYRSEARQNELYENKIQEHRDRGYPESEAVAAAATIVLPPGTSEHQTGLALDIVTPEYQMLNDGYAETTAAKWLAANAWRYGFVLRYPKDKEDVTKVIFEPWHYRYVGREHAEAMYEGDYCLEQYIYGVINPQRGDTSLAEPEDESQTNKEE